MNELIDRLEKSISDSRIATDRFDNSANVDNALKTLRSLKKLLNLHIVVKSEAAVCPICQSKNTFYAEGDFFYCRDCQMPFD